MAARRIFLLCVLLISLSTLVMGAYAQNKVHRGQTLEIKGKVVDELGQGVSGATVQLKDGTAVLASATSGSGGAFTISWNVPKSYPLGSKTLILYVPEQPSLYVEESSASLPIEVWDGTLLKLDSLPQRIHRGDEVSISGTLTMLSSGNPVSGARIIISCGQSELGSAETNSNGHFSFSFTVPSNWNRGSITLEVEFLGSPSIYLDGSTDSGRTALWIKPTIKVESVASG